jgi:hypothetical protein
MEAGEKKRPNVLKLCRHIQDLPGAIVQYGDPEYNGLACWVSDDEVTDRDEDEASQALHGADSLENGQDAFGEVQGNLGSCLHGVACSSSTPKIPTFPKVPDGKVQSGYHIEIFVPGIFEAMVDNIKLVEAHPIIAQSFAEYTIKRIMPLAGNIPVGHGVMRVVPIPSSVAQRSGTQRRRKD